MTEKRFLWLTIAFITIFFIILARLFYWQILNRQPLTAAADSQHWTSIQIPATRGQILDRENYPLVDNQTAYDLFLDRTLTQLPDAQIVDQILPIIAPDPQLQASTAARLATLTQNQDLTWIKLSAHLLPSVQKQLLGLHLSGLIFQPVSIRRYPEASTAAHLLGFVADNSASQPQGYFGLEGYYDLELAGKTGKSMLETDAIGNPIVLGQHHQLPGQPGRTLITHLDRTVQYLIETKLEQALSKYEAKAGTISLMDPRTGAIIAMAALPDYDPGEFANYPTSYYPNPIVNQSYEPGSTFKVLVMAAALNEHLVDFQTICPCRGPVSIPPYVISTWNQKYHPNSTISDIIQHSDNVGMVFVSRLFDPQVYVRYLRDFGFGQPTRIDLEEEASPPLRDLWREIDIATASFGQGIAVTPIQMLTAVSAIANHGQLMQPQVVDKISIPQSDQLTAGDLQPETNLIDIPTHPVRQVISPEAAQQMTNIMVNAVKNGEAKWTTAKGYKIAGKTGTAQIPVAGHYDDQKTIASFVGFAPADDPKFVMLVTLNEPQTSPWGSETAAPLWFDIAKQLFLHWNIPPNDS